MINQCLQNLEFKFKLPPLIVGKLVATWSFTYRTLMGRY